MWDVDWKSKHASISSGQPVWFSAGGYNAVAPLVIESKQNIVSFFTNTMHVTRFGFVFM